MQRRSGVVAASDSGEATGEAIPGAAARTMFLTRVLTAALHEKGGKEHEMPAHHQIEEAVDEYPSRVRIEKCSGRGFDFAKGVVL